MADALQSTGQYLDVSIDVPAANVPTFVSCMKQLLPVFTGATPATGDPTSFGWSLICAGRAASGDPVRFRHLWKMTNPARPLLWEVMQILGSDSVYGTLDAQVTTEVQDIMHTNGVYGIWTIPPRTSPCYVFEMLDMTADSIKLTAFDNSMEEVAVQSGWTLTVALMSQTGQLRRYLHYWQTDKPEAVPQVDAWLAARPEYKAAVLGRTTVVMNAVSYNA